MDIKMYVDKGSVHTWGQHLGASELCIRRKGWGMEGRWDFGTGVKHPGAGASLIRGQSHRDQKYKSAPVDDGHVVHVVGLVWQHTYTTAFEYNCDQETCMTYLRFLIEHTMHTVGCGLLWLVALPGRGMLFPVILDNIMLLAPFSFQFSHRLLVESPGFTTIRDERAEYNLSCSYMLRLCESKCARACRILPLPGSVCGQCHMHSYGRRLTQTAYQGIWTKKVVESFTFAVDRPALFLLFHLKTLFEYTPGHA